MLLDGMNHVAILTNDTDRLHSFYREVFEWPDPEVQRSFAFDIGGAIDDAFGVEQRRFLAHIEPNEGQFDVSRYRYGR